MNKTLKLWKALFGEDLTPGDCEIIGVEPDGTVIYYNATDGTCYNNGLTVDAVEDEEGKMNEREHIVTHPLQYVALLRVQLEACLTPKSAKGMNKGREAWKRLRIEKINDIAQRALSADPHKFVSNLKREAEFIQMKNASVPLKKAQRVGPEHAMTTKEPFLLGDNGRIISRAEFERRCYIQRAGQRSDRWENGKHVSVRKFAIYFGRDESTGTWKYAIGIYCNTREEAITRAFDTIKLWALNRGQNLARFEGEYYDMDFNRKIPLSF